jgi:hypothetical protein
MKRGGYDSIRPDPHATTPHDRAKTREEQRRLVRAGCATALGLLALGVIPLLGYVAFERLLRAATLGHAAPDLLVLQSTDWSARTIAWAIPVILIAAFGLMATAKSWFRLAVYGSAVVALGAGGLFYGCYADFVAIRAIGDGKIELIYLWPRPDIRLDPRGAVVAIESTLNPSDHSTVLTDRIVIEQAGRRYASAVSGAAQQAEALLVSRGATKGAARRAW